MYEDLNEAESLSNDTTKVIVKWSKYLMAYQNILDVGPEISLQISGSGLVAPSGMF